MDSCALRVPGFPAIPTGRLCRRRVQGISPHPRDTCLWLEVAPGLAVHRITDIALKASTVSPDIRPDLLQ